MIWSIPYPAPCNDTASALARFPAPTIEIRGLADGFADMPGSIAESACKLRSVVSVSTPSRKPIAMLYIVLMPKSPRPKSKPVKSRTGSKPKARLISSRTVYRGPVFWVTTDEVQEPGGVRARRDIIHHTGSVVVLVFDESGSTPRVLLERQYRHAAKDYLWELPAGRIDPGEKALQAAQRELLEETGYTASHWRRILKFYASPGFVAETMSVYLATGLRAGPAHPEADEVIHKRMFPLSRAIRMVLSGTIRDAKTISSLLWLDHQLRGK
jgi:ADP-ribose pyrophosphatase